MSKKPNLPGADALFGGQSAKDINPNTNTTPDNNKDNHDTQTSNHVYMNTSKHVNMHTSNKKKHKDEKSEKLIRYTLYFNKDLLDKLESIWLRLRKKHKIPKFKIVNLLLKEHLDDVAYIEKLLESESKN